MLGIHCQPIRCISQFISPRFTLRFLIMVDILQHIFLDILLIMVDGDGLTMDGGAIQDIGLLVDTVIDTTKITTKK